MHRKVRIKNRVPVLRIALPGLPEPGSKVTNTGSVEGEASALPSPTRLESESDVQPITEPRSTLFGVWFARPEVHLACPAPNRRSPNLINGSARQGISTRCLRTRQGRIAFLAGFTGQLAMNCWSCILKKKRARG